jgi:penicillin-binding protein 1B
MASQTIRALCDDDDLEVFVIRRHPMLFALSLCVGILAAAVFLRLAYLYIELGKGMAGSAGESPTIFYGRAMEIRAGEHVETLFLIQRLKRLSYREVIGPPTASGTFSREARRIRIWLRGAEAGTRRSMSGPVELTLSDGWIESIVSSSGKSLASIRLEPEEIGRMISPKLDARHQVTLDAVSPYLQKAVLAAEDSRFYSHIGLDPRAMARAFFADVKEKRFAEGASTITQQLAKNFFLSPKKTVARKLREAEIALALELRYSKKQILEMYLNKIYLGQTGVDAIYGVEDAAGIYFRKSAKHLSLEEAALLAGMIHAPNRYLLFVSSKAAKERRNVILSRMKKLNMISQDQYLQAAHAPIRLESGRTPVHLSSYFMDYVQRITRDEMGTQRFYHSGYRYWTTLDPVLQAAAEESVTRGLEEIEPKAKRAGEPLQAALIAVDPKTGQTVAMVGGRSYGASRFNRAVDAKRQPGSAFKPFVLLAALSQPPGGRDPLTLSTLISAEPITLQTPEGPWSPSNYEEKPYPSVTIRRMIEESVNTATVRLAQTVGFEEVLKAARLAGIKSPLKPVPSMALGSFEVSPLEIAYAYATFASGGTRFEPNLLEGITDASGEKIIDPKRQRLQTLNPRVAYLVSYALEGVLERGTAREAKALRIDFPVSGKTGTTNGYRDSWFVFYTPDIVCAVWVGYDSGAGTGLTGASGALRISARFLRTLYARSKPSVLEVPEGIETAKIDPESGGLATPLCPVTFQEAYLAGTTPKEPCPLHPESPVLDTLRKKVEEAKEFFRNLFK